MVCKHGQKYSDLELGVVSTPEESLGLLSTLQKYGDIYYNHGQKTYMMDPHNSSDEILAIFGNLNFPIIDKTADDMRENIAKWGYEDVMQHVWVCQQPIFGKPCGTCRPCQLKIEIDMSFLMSNKALKRYKNRDKVPHKYYYVILKKISRLLKL